MQTRKKEVVARKKIRTRQEDEEGSAQSSLALRGEVDRAAYRYTRVGA